MTAQMQQILEQLFSKKDLNDISVNELEEIIHNYPYFNIGQFLLAKKLKSDNNDSFKKQSEQAALYFHKPLWMEWLLESEMKEEVQPVPTITEEISNEDLSNEDQYEVVVALEEVKVEEIQLVETEFVQIETENIEMKNFEAEKSEAEIPVAEISEPKMSEPEIHEPEKHEPEKQEPEKHVILEDVPLFEPYHTVDYFASQGIKISTEIKQDDKLGQQLKSFTEWLRTMKRLPLSARQEELEINDTTQHDIQEFAAHSLDEKEVLTEAMAEVLLKQNKFEEAVEIYNKLSLQDPSKRAYFAGKIEQIKSELI